MISGMAYREVRPELLDALPPADRRAAAARRDLARLNAWMGHAELAARLLAPVLTATRSPRLADLGGGDGKFLSCLARRLRRQEPAVEAWLVDRNPAIDPSARSALEKKGWAVRAVSSDVHAWLSCPSPERFDVILANLFVHHFANGELRQLLAGAAERAPVFIALEPRRSRLALTFSHMVGLIGCNRITRHDAPVSVRAGFRDQELSRLWPRGELWELEEREVGWFSHLFIARRQPGAV